MRRHALAVLIASLCGSQANAKLIEVPNGDATLDLATLYAVNYDPYDSAIPRRRPGHPVPERPEWPDRNDGAVQPAPPDAVGEFVPLPDRWRIMEALGQKYPWYDPYNNNVWKGDKPIHGDDWFLSLLGVSDTVLEPRTIPTPVGAQSTEDPDSNDVFGDIEQTILAQTFLAGLVYYKGNTTFKPPEWEYRLTLAFNYNRVDVDDRRVLQIDPRLGDTRDDGFVAVQELFVDKHLRDVSARYDFDAVRFGIQPFSSDFRGFLFQDLQFGARLFGNRDNNRWQYNLAWFRRIEKDTNSGLNDVGAGLRDDDIFIANLYRQDWPRVGFTSQATIVHNRNREDEFFFDDNGFLARPSSLGTETLREYDATYVGYNGDGHFGRLNLTASAYYLFGDNIGTFTGRDSDLEAGFVAAEASMDFDWIRVRGSLAYASGDSDPFDDKSQGYDAIFENPIFAGADTSYWVRQNLPLIGGGGVALAGRNSLLPSLRSSRELGQSNFENPGLHLVGLGADFDLTPQSRVSANLNQLWFDDTATLEVARNQGPIDRSIGTDVSVAWIWRPFASQNAILRLSAAALFPASGLEDLYGSDDTYTTVLANIVLNY
ncbi:MAG TPA: hypothetical protein VN581_04155 [Patescibacteria group bacterium]|nr:hypothetical protein [Patescibacteria group bacterium]